MNKNTGRALQYVWGTVHQSPPPTPCIRLYNRNHSSCSTAPLPHTPPSETVTTPRPRYYTGPPSRPWPLTAWNVKRNISPDIVATRVRRAPVRASVRTHSRRDLFGSNRGTGWHRLLMIHVWKTIRRPAGRLINGVLRKSKTFRTFSQTTIRKFHSTVVSRTRAVSRFKWQCSNFLLFSTLYSRAVQTSHRLY